MGPVDYYDRGALAAAQALQGGFEDTRFRAKLEATSLAISFGEEAESTDEGSALLDMVVRLAARLFPTLQFDGSASQAALARAGDLVREINPNIELVSGSAQIAIVIDSSTDEYDQAVYAGSDAWDALLSTSSPQSIGGTAIPFGAGAAACFALATVFRHVFLDEPDLRHQPDLRYSTYAHGSPSDLAPLGPFIDRGRTVLIGAGAIGNAAIWALARAPLTGTIHVVDPETVELSNLQRYVLAARTDEGAVKATLVCGCLERGEASVAYATSHASFLEAEGHAWDHMLLALDTARDRRSAQSSLPKWIANAWTQPGDLGVSVHPSFSSAGSCVACLYLQREELKSEDELIAEALNVGDQLGQVRNLLVTGEGLSQRSSRWSLRGWDAPRSCLLGSRVARSANSTSRAYAGAPFSRSGEPIRLVPRFMFPSLISQRSPECCLQPPTSVRSPPIQSWRRRSHGLTSCDRSRRQMDSQA